MIEAQLEPDDAELRSDVLAWRSRTCWLTGRWDESFSSANAAVAALDGLPESPQLARALARLSQIEMLKHQDEAIGHAEEAIAVARRVDDLFAEVNARINLLSEQATRGSAPDPDESDRHRRPSRWDRDLRRGLPRDRQLRLVFAMATFLWTRSSAWSWRLTRHLADVPPQSIGAYFELSTAAMLLLPAGRWAEVDEVSGAPYGLMVTAATSRLVWLGRRCRPWPCAGAIWKAAGAADRGAAAGGVRQWRSTADPPHGLRGAALAAAHG